MALCCLVPIRPIEQFSHSSASDVFVLALDAQNINPLVSPSTVQH